MDQLDLFRIIISCLIGSLCAYLGYLRQRHLEIENRLTRMESIHVSEEKIKEMIKESTDIIYKQTEKLEESVEAIKKTQADLNIIVAILKEKLKVTDRSVS